MREHDSSSCVICKAIAEHEAYHPAVVRRALALLQSDRGICTRYVQHLELDDAIDIDDLRGHGKPKRWYFA
jgi:hypothetical protein